MKTLDTGSVDAVIADPPYNIGKASWDNIPDYLEWSREWITEAARVLKRQGAFWCFHSDPLVLADIAKIIEGQGKPNRNLITWEKATDSGLAGRGAFAVGSDGLRCFYPNSEYITYHADDGQWAKQNDDTRGFIFEPLRAYLVKERNNAGFKTTGAVDAEWQKMRGTKGCMAGHWFGVSQWELPTPENYEWLRTLFNANGGEDLRREYKAWLEVPFLSCADPVTYTLPKGGKMKHSTDNPKSTCRRQMAGI